jgi:restriction endonuclease S subunit
MKLSKLASIQSGTYTTSIKDGDVYYLQARDFDEDRQLSSNLAPTLAFEAKLEKHFLQKGDVLIVAKGASFLSSVYDGSFSPAVASTVFLVIRINKSNEIEPNYLSWFLNSQTVQTLLQTMSRGTGIPSINKQLLQELDIAVPSIEKQKLIIEVAQLHKNEKTLKRKIDELKENQLNYIITNAINK